MFLENTRPAAVASTSSTVAAAGPTFELSSSRHALQATARLQGGEFIVEAGSLARSDWEGTSGHSYRRLHTELVSSGVLLPDGPHRRFASSYAFKSPSAAAAVIFGRAANGQVEWKLKGVGLSYREWEAQQVTNGSGEAQ